MFELADSIGYLLNRAAAKVRVRLEQKLAPHGITAQQWAVLFLCFKTGAATPAALVRAVGIDGAAVTRLLDRMESKGLVRRKTNPANRRSLTVEITARGRALAPKLPPLAQQVLDEALAGFSAAEKRQLRALLRRVLDSGARTGRSEELANRTQPSGSGVRWPEAKHRFDRRKDKQMMRPLARKGGASG